MDELRIQIVTYNVAVRNPEGSVKDALGLDSVQDNKTPLPDFFIIGLQEVKAQPQNYLVDSLFNDPWTNSFKEVLAGLGYVKAKTIRLVGIIMSVFCLRKHVVHIRDMQTLVTRTGLKGLWGNKGGVSLRLQIYGCSLCFVNCHLAAHDHLLQERINDYNSILVNQKFDCRESVSILFHDYVFWFGDLNFRLNKPVELPSQEINNRVKKNDMKPLLEQDQLRIVMSSGDAFSELTEPPIEFPPTYKYNFHTSEYDLSRRPGWTDRILYKVNPNVYENVTLDITTQAYKAIDSVFFSDHKPVVGTFAIKVFSDYVERCVKFLPIQTWYLNETNTAIVVMGSDVEPNIWDWIGIYHDDFTGLDEYIAFIYMSNNNTTIDATGTSLPTIVRSGDRVELKFFENIIRVPRMYRLIYFSHNSGSVLAAVACLYNPNCGGRFFTVVLKGWSTPALVFRLSNLTWFPASSLPQLNLMMRDLSRSMHSDSVKGGGGREAKFGSASEPPALVESGHCLDSPPSVPPSAPTSSVHKKLLCKW